MKEKVTHKCLICNIDDLHLKGKESFVKLTEHIITGSTDMKKGEAKFIHATCLSNKLAIEIPDGFVYGRIKVKKETKKETKNKRRN